MICIESCHSMADGTLFRGAGGKNEASPLCVVSRMNYFPSLKKIETVMDFTQKEGRKAFIVQHRRIGWSFSRIQREFNAQVLDGGQLTKQE